MGQGTSCTTAFGPATNWARWAISNPPHMSARYGFLGSRAACLDGILNPLRTQRRFRKAFFGRGACQNQPVARGQNFEAATNEGVLCFEMPCPRAPFRIANRPALDKAAHPRHPIPLTRNLRIAQCRGGPTTGRSRRAIFHMGANGD
jgi:hypothetical protein